jgi:ribosome maturation factor RimP
MSNDQAPDFDDDLGPEDDLEIIDVGSGGGSPVADRVFTLLEPVVATADVELLDVEWTGGTLQVVLDSPDGVTIDHLATVNRLISPVLDQHDPVPGRYTLEVTSPGVERPLRRPEHYRRAVGENVVVKTNPGVEPRRVRGLLQEVSDEASRLTIEAVEIDGQDLDEVQYLTVDSADIAGARTIFDWGPTPKPGTGKPTPKGMTKKPGADAGSSAPRKPQKQSQRKAKKKAASGSASKQANKKPNTPQPNTSTQERGRP